MTHIPETRPANVVSFLENGTACVIFFPYAPELTGSEWRRIDAARRIRFFLYALTDAHVPPGQTGRRGMFEDYYPIASVRSALNRATYMCSELLPIRRRSHHGLVKALMNLAATACSDDHRCALLGVTDSRSLVDDFVGYRPSPAHQFETKKRGRVSARDD